MQTKLPAMATTCNQSDACSKRNKNK